MTATGPDQIAFMEQAGMPLSTTSHKEFTEVSEPTRLAYTSLIDFVPGLDPYEHLTVVTLTSTSEGTEVVMECEPLHDEVWTERIIARPDQQAGQPGAPGHRARLSPSATQGELPEFALVWWQVKDSNLRRRKPTDLQSAPIGRSGNLPDRHRPGLAARQRGETIAQRNGGAESQSPAPGQEPTWPTRRSTS